MPTPKYIKATGASLKRKRMPPAVQLSACTQNVMYADAMTAEAPAQPYSPIQPSATQESTSVAKASQQLNHQAPEPPSQNGTTLTYMHSLVIRQGCIPFSAKIQHMTNARMQVDKQNRVLCYVILQELCFDRGADCALQARPECTYG